jgi:hypothetical protein
VATGTSETDPNQSYADTRESFSSGISWCSAQHLCERNLFVWLTAWYSERTGGTSKVRTGRDWPDCRPRRLRANSLLTTA